MKRLLTYLLLLICCQQLAAQERTITGKILDGSLPDEPLIGATIAIGDGKLQNGTVTDYNGEFTLKVPQDTKVLTVRYLGYENGKITLVDGTDHYVVTLKSASHSISEVVVTGYQKIDRRKLTASVSQLNISDESVGAIKNIDQALGGQIAGLSTLPSTGAPGAPVKIRIRGTASINGTQEPLWVLDGIPLEGTDIPNIDNLNDVNDIYQTSIAGLNPTDIDNITVLKDAAATAIYGARAANGVIVITTKRGKESRPIVNFNTRLTFSPKVDINRLNLLNASEKVDLELALLASNYEYRQHKGGVANILDKLNEFNAYRAGGWNALSATAQQQINNLRDINTDWNDILFRNVFNQEYNASVSGGSDRASYYASAGYYDEQGIVKGVENNRYNFTLKGTFKINKKLTLGASIFANQRKQASFLTDTGGFTNPVYYSREANPYFQPFKADGSYNYDTNVQGRENNAPDFNIFEERANTSKRRRDYSIMSIIDAEYKINSDLKLTSQFGYQFDNYNLCRYQGGDSYAMRKEKEYATYMTSSGVQQTIFPEGGANKTTDSYRRQWLWKAMAEYNHRFAKYHDVELMLGTEVRHNITQSTSSNAYGYDARTLTTKPVVFPSQSIAERYPLHQETRLENAYVSWYATGSYTYHYRYTLGASVRFDGSDVFGVAKKYRYLPLYSVSALWRVSEEKWMQPLTWISDLRLRASYGLQGNIDKSTSPYLIGTIDKASILGKNETIIAAETAPNPNLKWEKTSNVNLGLEAAFLDSRIHFSVDYYHRKSSDLIGIRMLPLETGFASTTINWASMKNDGWELSLSTRNIVTRDFHWTTNLNLGFNTNKIINESVAQNSTYPSRQGYPVGALFAYKTAGLDSEGYPLFLAADGSKVSAADFFKLNRYGASQLTAEQQRAQYTYMGSTDPKCSGGLINNFEYRNWQLGVNFMFNLGMKVRVQPSYSPTYFDRGLNTNRDILSRWTATNTGGTFAALMVSTPARLAEYTRYAEYNTYSMLDIWVRNSSYARMQSLRLGYKLPKKWLAKFGISSASLSLEGRNLLVIASNYNNYLDPETMGNPFAQPVAKSYIFGLNVNF
ncbi:MAG: SusC/RagA family TonB-linked outer membrane protein [Prevotella sp.]